MDHPCSSLKPHPPAPDGYSVEPVFVSIERWGGIESVPELYTKKWYKERICSTVI